MPHGDPDPTDPLTLHGVVVETQDGQAIREMAKKGPIRHLKEESRRRVVLGQGMRCVEEAVRNQVAGTHEHKGLAYEFGILYCAAPAQAVEAFA